MHVTSKTAPAKRSGAAMGALPWLVAMSIAPSGPLNAPTVTSACATVAGACAPDVWMSPL
jgi:hypothetical protein